MISIDDTLARGGAERIALLRYCVMSVTMEPVFLMLVQEYRYRPTLDGALALYDMFCALNAPARLGAYALLPPRELTVGAAIEHIRSDWNAMRTPVADSDADEHRATPSTPARGLFDAIVRGVRADPDGRLAALRAAYDPTLTPQENLPGGRMTPGQRQFVEGVWTPIVRPRLTAAGFWQMTTIG